MTRSSRWAALLAIAALPLLGCGDDRDDEPLTVGTYADRWATAVCGEMSPCCADNGVRFDESRCTLGAAAFVQTGVDAALDADARFDVEAAAACIEAARRATAACRPLAELSGSGSPCDRVFLGNELPGSVCESVFECAPTEEGRRACAVGSDGAGRCVVESPPASVGDPCGGSAGTWAVADCAGGGLQCSLGGTCVALGALGEPCGELLHCERDAYCSPSGTCEARSSVGASCDSDAACASGACIGGTCAPNAVGRPTPCGAVAR